MLVALHPESVYTDAVSRHCETDRLAQAKQFFQLVDHPRMAVRTLPASREIYGDWAELDDLAAAAVGLSRPDESGPAGVYMVINPPTEKDFLSFANGKGDGKTIADRHIERRTLLYVDVDPDRHHPDGGQISANEDERAWAKATMEGVVALADLHGFSEPVIVNSGNGYQIHFRIDLPNDNPSKLLVKSVLAGFANVFDCEQGHIDASVYNAARLARLPGTFNRKGSHSEDRPHRLARIVSAPASGVMTVTSKETLAEFVSQFGKATSKPSASLGASVLGDVPPEVREQVIVELLEYLQENDAPPVTHISESTGMSLVHFAYCPFRGPEHTDGDPSIVLRDSGGIGFKCFHEHCKEQTWLKLQRLIGPLFQSKALSAFAAENRDSIHRRYDDPLLLAKRHLELTQLSGGRNSLVFVSGQTFQYWIDRAWQPVLKGELDAPVRSTIQSEYDARYFMCPWLKNAPKVTSGIVANTVKAIESEVHFPTDPSQMPPFWLSDKYDSDPSNLLIARNGIVDVMAYAEGREYFFPRTPDLFSRSVGAYDFDPKCLDAPSWFGFLDSLQQSEDWTKLLQEMMGCFLCGGHDLQKIYMFVGPPRCGKGTIQKVLEKLLGQDNVCSPNLIDFAKPFGLEQTLGTRLAIVPEVAFPPRETTQIVGTLKAISGGDVITIDRKHIKNIPVRLKMKILLVTNNFVALPDNSKALPSRIVPLRFTNSFLGKEDLELGWKLGGELPAIVNWSLDGFRRLIENKGIFTLPDSSRELMEQLLTESAPLQSFLQDACGFDPRKGVYKQSLYEKYKSWSKDHDSDRGLLSVVDFARELQAAASHISLKRASSREAQQGTFMVIPTPFDGKVTVKRPETWVGIYCREDT